MVSTFEAQKRHQSEFSFRLCYVTNQKSVLNIGKYDLSKCYDYHNLRLLLLLFYF